VSSRAHHLGALDGRRVAPGLEALLRGRQGQVQIGLARVRHAPDFLAGRRVEHGQRLARLGIAPLALNEELGVGVRQGSLLKR
jgi:hypothetical protein